MSEQRAIFERYPALRESLPFIQLGELPTPVHRITGLEEAVGVDKLWIKRDDISALDYGGNKIRKLEFLLAAAKQNGCSHVITYGGFGSNHALATALNCKKLGLQCVAVLTPEPATDAVRRQLRYHQAIGTEFEIAYDYNTVREAAQRAKDRHGEANCYEIPFGGSSWLGAIGFVNAGLELAQQVAAGTVGKPDVIYLGCGTAGSIAGLALGLMLADIPSSIQAVQVTPESMQPEKLFKRLFREAGAELSARDPAIQLPAASEAGVTIRMDQLGRGYAIPTDACRVAGKVLQQQGGMPASPTYTAKTFAALMADAGRGILADKNVLFWNTYNSREYPELPTDDSWRELPEDFHAIFDEALIC